MSWSCHLKGQPHLQATMACIVCGMQVPFGRIWRQSNHSRSCGGSNTLFGWIWDWLNNPKTMRAFDHPFGWIWGWFELLRVVRSPPPTGLGVGESSWFDYLPDRSKSPTTFWPFFIFFNVYIYIYIYIYRQFMKRDTSHSIIAANVAHWRFHLNYKQKFGVGSCLPLMLNTRSF